MVSQRASYHGNSESKVLGRNGQAVNERIMFWNNGIKMEDGRYRFSQLGRS